MKELGVIKLIIFYILYSFTTDLLTNYFGETPIFASTLSDLLSSLFTIIEFCCFSLFFYFTLQRHFFLRKVILFFIGLFTIFCVTNIFMQFSKYDKLDRIPVSFQAIFIMSLCVVYFFEQIRNPHSLFIYSTWEFWVVTAILVYLAGTFFIYIYSADLTDKELDQYWSINYVFNTIKNLLFGLAIFIHGRSRKKTTENDALNYYSIIENP